MATVPDALLAARTAGRLLVACDVSPPRAAALDVEAFRPLVSSSVATATEGGIVLPPQAGSGGGADFLCCAYLPGRAVRLPSTVMAHLLERELGANVIFNLATRDMNRLALSVALMGAVALGLENAVALRGDDFAARDRARVRAVHDTSPSELVALAAALAAGRDFRDTALAAPVPICMGAAMDFSRDFEREVRLAVKKARAGARFFLTQSIYDATLPERFAAAYREAAGENLTVPVLWGVPVLVPGGIDFGDVPPAWRRDLDAGRPGAEIARTFLGELRRRGVDAVYLVPPILRGGDRDYRAAVAVLATL